MFGFGKKKSLQTSFVIDRVENDFPCTTGTVQVEWRVWFRKDGIETLFLSNIAYQSTINGLVLEAVRHEARVGDGRDIVVADDTGGYKEYINELLEIGVALVPDHYIVKKESENAEAA
jgi:hypothetical protein